MDASLENHLRTPVLGKRLAAVDFKSTKNHQHEINAGLPGTHLFGTPSDKPKFACRYVYISDDLEAEVVDSTLTFYDPRRNDPTRKPEWRIFYPSAAEPILDRVDIGDLCWVAQYKDSDNALFIVSPAGSSAGRRLDLLFGTDLLGQDSEAFVEAHDVAPGATGIDLEDADLLSSLGIEPEIRHADLFERLLALLEDVAPAKNSEWQLHEVADFTKATRSLSGIDPSEDPDEVMRVWLDVTNDLYFQYEQAKVGPWLREHVGRALDSDTFDVAEVLRVVTKVKNSRVSRAGASFESHIDALFKAKGVEHTWVHKKLSDQSKPDFILPSVDHYEDPSFTRPDLLTFVGAKTSSKERWRQLAGEATRIATKHLFTYDKDLTNDTIAAMTEHSVVPVIPRPIIETAYATSTRVGDIWTIARFIEHAKEHEGKIAGIVTPAADL